MRSSSTARWHHLNSRFFHEDCNLHLRLDTKNGWGVPLQTSSPPFFVLNPIAKKKEKKHPITYKMTNLWLMTKAENGCDRRRYR